MAAFTGVLDSTIPFAITLPDTATVANGTVYADLSSYIGGAVTAATLAVSGESTLTGDVAVGSALTVAATTALSGTLDVTGTTTLGRLTTTNDVTMTLPTYATNVLAVAGGLAVGRVYKTATGELRIVVP